jgi:hypothetical protein
MNLSAVAKYDDLLQFEHFYYYYYFYYNNNYNNNNESTMPRPNFINPEDKRKRHETISTQLNMLFSRTTSVVSLRSTAPSKDRQNVEHSSKTPAKSSFFKVYQQLYLALYDEQQALKMSRHAITGKFIIIPRSKEFKKDTSECLDWDGFLPSSLIDIYMFINAAKQTARRNPDSKLIFVVGSNFAGLSKMVFLMGCHMIISEGIDVGSVNQTFERFDEVFVHKGENKLNILDSWRAVEQASCVGWIDFEERFDTEDNIEGTIDMEEFTHYSRSNIALPVL